MKAYSSKPVPVDAIQWQPGCVCEHITERKPELVFSRDGRYYYLSANFKLNPKAKNPLLQPNAWLPVAPQGELAAKADILPFAFYELKSDKRVEATLDDPLVKRYLEFAECETLPLSYGIINRDTVNGKKSIDAGQWLVVWSNIHGGTQKLEIFDNEEFEKRFEQRLDAA